MIQLLEYHVGNWILATFWVITVKYWPGQSQDCPMKEYSTRWVKSLDRYHYNRTQQSVNSLHCLNTCIIAILDITAGLLMRYLELYLPFVLPWPCDSLLSVQYSSLNVVWQHMDMAKKFINDVATVGIVTFPSTETVMSPFCKISIYAENKKAKARI